MASQPYILYSMPEITVSISRAGKQDWGTTPECFDLQSLSAPGVMYFISLVRFPRVDNPSMSVRRPGTELDEGEASSTEPILQER